MFLGDPNLRGSGEQIEYTPEMLAEYIKCAADPIYFAEKYFHITSIDFGRQKIKLFDFQKKIIKAYMDPPEDKRHVCLLSSRQIGKCCDADTKILIRNKKTGEIKEITMADLFKMKKQV